MSSPSEERSQPRIIPGAPPKASTAAKKRSHKKTKATAGSLQAGQSISSAADPALQSALVDEAPTPSALPEELTTNGLGLGLPSHGLTATGPIISAGGAASPELSKGVNGDGLKKTLPAEVVHKKIRAITKKLQRISAYEAQTEALNPDQKKAVASKPGLELTVKELQDLAKLFEGEEAEEERRLKAIQDEVERSAQRRIAAAIADAEQRFESDLTLLLQFLRLHSFFNPSAGFAPAPAPPIVQNATGQEAAAVSALYAKLTDGPLLGGGDDAVTNVAKLGKGAADSIIEGVDFARVKQMIVDLTAPPVEVPDEHVAEEADVPPPQTNGHDHSVDSSAPAVPRPADAEEGDLEGAEPPHLRSQPLEGMTFMQASEIMDGPVSFAPDQPATVPEPVAPVPEPSQQPDAEPFMAAGPAEPVREEKPLDVQEAAPIAAAPPAVEQPSKAAAAGDTWDSVLKDPVWEEKERQVTNWAEEVQAAQDGPTALTGEATPAAAEPAAPVQAPRPPVENQRRKPQETEDGFQPVGRRRGGGEFTGGYRGGRGFGSNGEGGNRGYGGRGGRGGGFRQSSSGGDRSWGPREGGAEGGDRPRRGGGEFRGEYRGRGRGGEHRGGNRGRGEFRGFRGGAGQAPAAAPQAP